MSEQDMALAVQAAMRPLTEAAFLNRMIRMNPSWRGAQPADLLDALGQSDARLDIIEPLYEAHGSDVPEPHLLAYAAYVAIYAFGAVSPEAAWDRAQPIIAEVRRLTLAAQAADVPGGEQ